MNQPRVKSRSQRIRSRRPVHRHFGPEPLEPRHLPSVTLPGIAATSPADGATLLRGPQSFAITFNQSDVENIGAAFSDLFGIAADQVLPTVVALDLDAGADVEIDRVGADGTVTQFLGGGGGAWALQETVNTTVAPDGTIQTQLDITLPPGSPTMTPGTYQLDVQPLSNLGAAFAWVEPTSAWATATAPIPIARFTVVGQGPTFGGAARPGTHRPEGAERLGFHRSRQLSIGRRAVPVQRTRRTALAVRRQGPRARHRQPVAIHGHAVRLEWRRAGHAQRQRRLGGRFDRSRAGPGPGAGYVLPRDLRRRQRTGQAGGYDPESGKPGTAGVNDPAGPFQLELSATPTTESTRLVDFNLDYADSLEPSPTGLDLTFSAPVDVTGLSVPDRQETALTVVDSSGRSWPISAVSYQSAQDRLSFIFNEALPPGRYTLVAPTQGGLTDLSGRPVGGPVGNPSNVLASWTVAAPDRPERSQQPRSPLARAGQRHLGRGGHRDDHDGRRPDVRRAFRGDLPWLLRRADPARRRLG